MPQPTTPLEPAAPRHTPECLAERLAELEATLLAEIEAALYRRFPALAADSGVDVAWKVALRYQAGEVSSLKNVAGYLRRAAFREALRRAHSEPHRVPLEAVPLVWPPPQNGNDLSHVREALDALPPKQKDAVCLHVVLGLSLGETARQMGVARQTVSRRVEAALARLKSALAGYEKTANSAAGCAS